MRFATKIAGRFLATLIGVALSGCFLTDVMPIEPKKKKTGGGGGKEEEEKPPEEKAKTPPRLSGPRQVRRLSLDLRLRLPAAADMAAVAENPAAYPRLVDAWLAEDSVRRNIAALHTRIWKLSPQRLPDLDRYVADGNATLGNQLTAAARTRIAEEPTLRLRHVLERRQPFPELFRGAWSIVHANDLALWGLSEAGTPWAEEPYRYADYADGRPPAGILSDNGLLAAFASRADPALRHRTARLLTAMTCADMEKADAHTFYDLTGAELQSDLGALAATRAPCMGCHGQMEAPGQAMSGLGAAQTFSAWLTYAAPAQSPSGVWAGQTFTGSEDFAAILADDPRLPLCEVRRLLSHFYQRPAGDRDISRLALAMDRYRARGEDIVEAVKYLLKNDEYTWEVVSRRQKKAWLYGASGVHVLGRAQWQGIMDDLTPGHGLEFSDDLDAGRDEEHAGDWWIPTGRYWRAVERIARQAATVIVSRELAEGMPSVSRRLLTKLPNGTGVTDNLNSVDIQIRAVWKRLTGEDMADDDQTLAALITLWQATGGGAEGAGAAAVQLAWRTMLTAMMTHPAFITY